MRKKHSRNVLLLLLSALMVCGCFYGCNSDKNTETETGDSSENVGTETTETPYVLPTADLGAEEMVILSPYGKIWQFDSTWHYNSDELNAGLFKRDKKVEDVLNCTIQMEYVEGSNIAEQFTTKLEAEMLAQTGAYDVVYAETANGLDFKGYFNNLLDSDLSAVLALDEPFFFQSWNDTATINDVLVSAMSYGSVEMMSSATVTIFNHDWWRSLFEGNIYDYVYDGSWTLDVMQEMGVAANIDQDGQGLNTASGDKFGICYLTHQGRGMFYSLGGRFFTKNGNGELEYDLVSDKNIQVFGKLYDFLNKNETLFAPGYTESSPVFLSEQALFVLGYFDAAKVFKKSGSMDFGFLPNPKLDTTQKDSVSTISGGACFSIPKTASNKVNSGIFLNAYSYYSYDMVRPAYFDSLLKVQLSKDQDSANMVDLVMNNLYVDFAYIHNSALGGISDQYFNLIRNKKEGQFVSTYLGFMDSYEANLETLLADFIANNG